MPIPKLHPKIISPLADSQVLGTESTTNTDTPLVLLVGTILVGMTAVALVARHLLKERKHRTPVTSLAKD